MLLAFLFGFLFAIICLIAGVIYAFNKLNTHFSTTLQTSAHARAENRHDVDAAAHLDPIKIISKVQFGTFDGVAPLQHPDQEDKFTRAEGRSVRYGRITLVGSVISVYETVVMDRSGAQRPIKEKIRREGKKDSSPSTGGPSSSGGVVGGVGGGIGNVLGGIIGGAAAAGGADLSDLLSGEPASERLVGKIPIARLQVTIESLADSPTPILGTASTATRYLVLRRLGADESVAGAAADPIVYTFPPAKDGADEKEGADLQKWLGDQDPKSIIPISGPPLFSYNGARPDTKRGIIMFTPPQGAGGGATTEREYASFSHHEDTPIRWRTIMIRFSTVRELERWSDVLQPTFVTNQWKVFLKSLPQVDVLNVLMSRIFFENRELKELNDIVQQKINKSLSNVVFPSSMSKSRAVASWVNVGGELPILSNISPLATSACGEIAFDFDVWYRGGFTCKMLVDLALNNDKLVKIDFKAPPVEATVHLKELKGRVHLSIGAPPSHRMWLGFHELPEVIVELSLELVKTKEGEGNTLAKLIVGALPDLSAVLSSVVREKLFEDMTLPHLDDFPVPNVEKTPPPSPRSAAAAGGVGGGPSANQSLQKKSGKGVDEEEFVHVSRADAIDDRAAAAARRATPPPQHHRTANAQSVANPYEFPATNSNGGLRSRSLHTASSASQQQQQQVGMNHNGGGTSTSLRR